MTSPAAKSPRRPSRRPALPQNQPAVAPAELPEAPVPAASKTDGIGAPATLDSRDTLLALGLGAAVVLLLLAFRPLAGVPMNDDFSYAHSARVFAETGRIAYNGWGSPMLWPQAAYGALVIKLFGFSWRALAATGIVAAGLCAGLMYALARRCGAARFPALLATAALVLNPPFLGVAPSFMTDLPSLVLLLGAFWALIGSLERTGEDGGGDVRLRPGRFALAVALGVVAGTNRQVSWVAFLGALLALVPFVRGVRERLWVMGGAALVAGVAGALTIWLGRQPYTIPADVSTGLIFLIGYTNIAAMFIFKFLNMAGLLLLPLALLALASQLARSVGGTAKRFGWVGAASGLVALVVLCLLPLVYGFGTTLRLLGDQYRLTAYGQYFTSNGVVVGGVHGFSKRPVVLGPGAITLLVVGGALGMALSVYLVSAWMSEMRARRRQRRQQAPADAPGAVAETVAPHVGEIGATLVLVGSVAQILVSLPWYAQLNVFDRYLLFILPGFLILFAAQASRRLARPQQRSAGPGAFAVVPIVLVAGMGALGAAFASEYFAYTRARATLYQALRAQNVPREQIDAGFELDADTQVRREGYINHEGLQVPPDAYRPERWGRFVAYSPEHFPALDVHYLLSSDATPTEPHIDPQPVRRLEYSSLLPPRARTLYVYRIRRDAPDPGAARAAEAVALQERLGRQAPEQTPGPAQ